MTQPSAASQPVRPLQIDDITVIDNTKLKKAVTAAALGNAMEWFDFGVYGFVTFALGKVFFPDASPTVQTIAALGTFRSEEHTSELQSLMRTSYAVFCLKKKNTKQTHHLT